MKKSLITTHLVLIASLLFSAHSFSQQDPQYTQYMYNTLSINPGYTGSRGALSAIGLHRTQWIGIDGAPRTSTLAVHSPLENEKLALGLSVIYDAIGPADETYIDLNFSYTINVNANSKIGFGLKTGAHLLNVDFSKGSFREGEQAFFENITNRFSPTIGAGIYYYRKNAYLGFSVPNFLTTEHYDELRISTATERLHYFLIGGLVLNLNPNLKFKPAFLAKAVSGSPLAVDLSGSFIFNDRFVLGGGYRLDDSFSGLAGIYISQNWFLGLAYDHTISGLGNYNDGSHEIVLRFEVFKSDKFKSPRFF